MILKSSTTKSVIQGSGHSGQSAYVVLCIFNSPNGLYNRFFYMDCMQKAFADRVELDPVSLDRVLSVTDSPPPHTPPPPTSLTSPLGRLHRSEVSQSIDHKKVPMFRKPTLSLDTPGDSEETRVGLLAFPPAPSIVAGPTHPCDAV